MNIAVIGNNSNGMYLFRRQLISTLIGKGNSVTILTPFDTDVDHLEKLGATLIETPMERRGTNPYKDFTLMKVYHRRLRELSPDLVITYTIKPNIYGGLICRRLRIPYVANVTGLGSAFEGDGFVRQAVRLLSKIALRDAKIIFFENDANKQVFIDERIVDNSKALTLHGAGVDLDYFKYQPYPDERKTFRFLFIGRVMKEKGVDELLGAMEILRGKGLNCTLDILGNYEEERYKEKLENSSGWLHYYGNQPDVRPYIKDCDCFVLPSYHEGMANTVLECAASGRPIITSNIPGCKEAVIDGVSGFLCEKENTDSLYRAMKKMAGLCRADRSAMGRSGRKLMEESFDKRIIVEMTISSLFAAGVLL